MIPRVQSPANLELVSQMSTLPRSTRINREMAKALSMGYALRLEGENKKRLLVGRLTIACKGAEMHLSHGKYVMDKHNTGRHCIGDSCLILPSKWQNVHMALRKRAVILSIARHPFQVYVQRDSRGIQILRSHGSGIFPYAVTIQVACL